MVEYEEILAELRQFRFAIDEQGVSHTLGKEVDELRLPSIIQQNSPFVASNKKMNFLLPENNPVSSYINTQF